MTVGGTGDVLAGVTARLLAEIEDPLWAASATAFTTGAAGNLAAEEYGNGLTASDVAERVGWVMKRWGV